MITKIFTLNRDHKYDNCISLRSKIESSGTLSSAAVHTHTQTKTNVFFSYILFKCMLSYSKLVNMFIQSFINNGTILDQFDDDKRDDKTWLVKIKCWEKNSHMELSTVTSRYRNISAKLCEDISQIFVEHI